MPEQVLSAYNVMREDGPVVVVAFSLAEAIEIWKRYRGTESEPMGVRRIPGEVVVAPSVRGEV